MKILFVHQGLQSYVQKDLDILRGAHQVRAIQFTPNLLRLWQGVLWCDLTFSWFGKLHAFFAVLFSKFLGKKAIVVAGGDDVAKVPDINYGIFCSAWKPILVKFALRKADLILTVSKSNTQEAIENTKVSSKKIRMIYHGFDYNFFKRDKNIPKENLVIVVSEITDEKIMKKGLDLFVKSAKLLPKINFKLIGASEDGSIEKLKALASSNVDFVSVVGDEDLVKLMNRAKIYAQPSRHEGFGCALAEAMLCECVPVVFNATALPEVVGGCGYYLNNLTCEELAGQIKRALQNYQMGSQARERVIREFPLQKRRKKILTVLEELTKDHKALI